MKSVDVPLTERFAGVFDSIRRNYELREDPKANARVEAWMTALFKELEPDAVLVAERWNSTVDDVANLHTDVADLMRELDMN